VEEAEDNTDGTDEGAQAESEESERAELERQAAERAALQPPIVADPEENAGTERMGKQDFLRRLRTTAENVERGRTSERTEARTDGDVTVLSNVGSPEASAPEEAQPTSPREKEGAAEEGLVGTSADREKQDRETTTYANGAAARNRPLDEPEGQWHWLWVLGGLATALLLPIGVLLTRATRNS
jgi:hypothetical protein